MVQPAAATSTRAPYRKLRSRHTENNVSTITTNVARRYLTYWGSGQPVVFTRLAVNADSWERRMLFLARRLSLHSPDRRGHGRSSRLERQRRHVATIRGGMDTLDLNKGALIRSPRRREWPLHRRHSTMLGPRPARGGGAAAHAETAANPVGLPIECSTAAGAPSPIFAATARSPAAVLGFNGPREAITGDDRLVWLPGMQSATRTRSIASRSRRPTSTAI